MTQRQEGSAILSLRFLAQAESKSQSHPCLMGDGVEKSGLMKFKLLLCGV